MLENSVVARTGQAWKLALALVLMLVGSFAPLWAGTGISWTLGTVLAIAGYTFGVVLIVCPACSSRWFWSAALDATLYKPLLQVAACPACKRDFSRP